MVKAYPLITLLPPVYLLLNAGCRLLADRLTLCQRSSCCCCCMLRSAYCLLLTTYCCCCCCHADAHCYTAVEWNPLCCQYEKMLLLNCEYDQPGHRGEDRGSFNTHSNNTPPRTQESGTTEQHTKLNSFIFHFFVEVRSEVCSLLS